MRFTCEKYPGLWVHDVGIRFVDGEAEATGKAADVLMGLPNEYGVEAVEGAGVLPVPPESQPDVPVVERPSQNDPKAKWSWYVQQAHGLDPDDADAMTKAELVAYEGGE